jgi:hypothetical protein
MVVGIANRLLEGVEVEDMIGGFLKSRESRSVGGRRPHLARTPLRPV